MGIKVYIGAEEIVSALGGSAAANFEQLLQARSGISLYREAGWRKSDVYLSKVPFIPDEGKFRSLVRLTLTGICRKWDARLLSSPQTLVVISSTKGDLPTDLLNPFGGVLTVLQKEYRLVHTPLVISNACVSGVLAINVAARLLKAGLYQNVVVLGCDVISDFVLYGFQALYAVSDQPCRPFDLNRKGVTLGEGCGGVVLSVEKSVFTEAPVTYLGGADANDANHISGPSRTGEGLVRAVEKSFKKAGTDAADIGYISAHGTGTSFNDEMEAIAFHRLGLQNVPLNSLKAYWGHTLGAAGVIETAACIQSLRAGKLVASLGYADQGTSKSLNVLTGNRKLEADTILKTASGFGGGNAALIIRKL